MFQDKVGPGTVAAVGQKIPERYVRMTLGHPRKIGLDTDRALLKGERP
jgi:hypothetical protein